MALISFMGGGGGDTVRELLEPETVERMMRLMSHVNWNLQATDPLEELAPSEDLGVRATSSSERTMLVVFVASAS